MYRRNHITIRSVEGVYSPQSPSIPRSPCPSTTVSRRRRSENAGRIQRHRLRRPQVPGKQRRLLEPSRTVPLTAPFHLLLTLPLFQARCIADVRADAGSTTFLAGTLSLKEENEVHLIRLSPAESELVCDGLFYHPNEIWDLKSCPFDHRVFSTVYTSGEGYGASVWKIPEFYGQSNSPQLEQLFTLDEHTGKIRCVLWWPLGKHDKLISIDDRNIFLWNIDASNKSAKVIQKGSADMLPNLRGGAWDPHNHNSVAAITDSSLHFWDLRSMKKSNAIEHAHFRDVDYNPKKQHLILNNSGGGGTVESEHREISRVPREADGLWGSKFASKYYGCSNSSSKFLGSSVITQPDRYLMIVTSGGLNQQRTGRHSKTNTRIPYIITFTLCRLFG
ncbi:hypothetical protein E2562_007210 [Oryza meyeriana var. granulata]|uniref:EIPR1-like beta-propeller domain-containing protein n=1 Tax=Oryza meyeriana var. granulata TaxID=110450 RepID=A0A6G1CDY8_9ORYZ|nr:hypothetical protein E2562_007210 [Oryza meyeriana var. granulata]